MAGDVEPVQGPDRSTAELIRPDHSSMLTPPGASTTARRWAARFVRPIESFLHVEASSGVVLLVMAAVAMVIASSAWAGAFHHLLELPIGLSFGSMKVERPLHFWINDGLMTIFFFVVGLEIRREIHEGELSNLRRAVLPLAAAVGGMVAPALLYLRVRGAQAGGSAWMGRADGDRHRLRRRRPRASRKARPACASRALARARDHRRHREHRRDRDVLLGRARLSGFAIAAGGIAGILLLQRLGVRRASIYVIPGVIVWFGVCRSGVHPTIAGVIVGLLTPARSWLGPKGFVALARRSAEAVEQELANGKPGVVAPERVAEEAARIDLASREALSPATRLQMMLHPWVAFVIMPVFALANAGVTLDKNAATPSLLSAGIVVGLVAGKPIGILSACFAVVRLRITTLPRGIGWRELSVLGLVAGIGFTMALFVAALAFPEGQKLEQAKTAILVASALAMTIGLLAGRFLLRPEVAGGAARTASEAESSDEL